MSDQPQTPMSRRSALGSLAVGTAAVVATQQRIAGRFILATNVLENNDLTPSQALVEYKEQQTAERGFRFLKDLLFFTSSVFLKSPK